MQTCLATKNLDLIQRTPAISVNTDVGAGKFLFAGLSVAELVAFIPGLLSASDLSQRPKRSFTEIQHKSQYSIHERPAIVKVTHFSRTTRFN